MSQKNNTIRYTTSLFVGFVWMHDGFALISCTELGLLNVSPFYGGDLWKSLQKLISYGAMAFACLV